MEILIVEIGKHNILQRVIKFKPELGSHSRRQNAQNLMECTEKWSVPSKISKYTKNHREHWLVSNSEFLSGVGKSKTINTCAQWVEHLLRKAGPYLPRVLILGPTGASAALIGNNMINCHNQSFSLKR